MPASSPSRSWGLLLVLCGAIFLEGIDIAMFNVALPAIRDDLGMSTSSLQWVMSAYVLGYGGFMLLGGRAADLFGRRRMFVAWLVVFLLFSGLGGLATEGWLLILARFVTGISAAFMTPAGLSIITTTFEEGPRRNRALLIYSGTAAGGFSCGLVIGGFLTAIDWRWVFFAPVLLAAVILVGALTLVPKVVESRPADRRLDVAGAITVTAAIILLVLGVERATHTGAGWTVATVGASLALFAVFVLVERRTAAPLLRLGLLRSGPLVRANLTALLLLGGFYGFQFLAVLYLQELRGWSTLETSFAMLVIGADAVLSPTVVPRLVERFGNARVILTGMLLAAVAYALFLPVGADWTYLAMLPSFVLLSLSFAMAYGPLTIVATEGVPEEDQGVAGGLLYTSFQFGAALGLSAVTAVNVAATGDDGSPAALLDGYRAALVVPLVCALLAAGLAAVGVLTRGGRPGPAAPAPAGTPPQAPVAEVAR
ncbi:MFS transporter [Streptomyces hainanensis]|uniref:MFS transporter n=1 Tax=Streptomyces hainanensis TaxID=402648 RepID=A0A4R4TGD5_9ACTN|nr:MFS transporter [Streptomyces hainanensis]TDC74282.1 MFS transporter [Streptomyces hainanensis]